MASHSELCFRCNTIRNYIQQQQETGTARSASTLQRSCRLSNFITGARRGSPGAMGV
ncbi:uncharacterized protein V6R79_021248 [Siganus canaliculatus]